MGSKLVACVDPRQCGLEESELAPACVLEESLDFFDLALGPEGADVATETPVRGPGGWELSTHALENLNLLVVLSQEVVGVGGVGGHQYVDDGRDAVVTNAVLVDLDRGCRPVGVERHADRGLHEENVPPGSCEFISEIPKCMLVLTRNPLLKSEEDRRLVTIEIGITENLGLE